MDKRRITFLKPEIKFRIGLDVSEILWKFLFVMFLFQYEIMDQPVTLLPPSNKYCIRTKFIFNQNSTFSKFYLVSPYIFYLLYLFIYVAFIFILYVRLIPSRLIYFALITEQWQNVLYVAQLVPLINPRLIDPWKIRESSLRLNFTPIFAEPVERSCHIRIAWCADAIFKVRKRALSDLEHRIPITCIFWLQNQLGWLRAFSSRQRAQ